MTSKEKILEAIKQNPNASYMDLAKACGMSKTNVFHHVNGLIESGLVRHGFKWEVL
ncbi:HTH_ARSR domain containing protein [uncultured Caudovirales phage]|uniref:HTH_ARSR domain containing protein n=1 Tax=uncultured Caudovirales phage TaxID=2100421 RepID=A0A6J7WFU7_9CAUD|nr:HTH_ARSR domain containing protein [uncultured Caudovirales phage]